MVGQRILLAWFWATFSLLIWQNDKLSPNSSTINFHNLSRITMYLIILVIWSFIYVCVCVCECGVVWCVIWNTFIKNIWFRNSYVLMVFTPINCFLYFRLFLKTFLMKYNSKIEVLSGIKPISNSLLKSKTRNHIPICIICFYSFIDKSNALVVFV